MGAFGWVVLIIIVGLLLFTISSTETQDKIITNSGPLSKLFKFLQGESVNTEIVKINNVDYVSLGKPKRQELVEINCEANEICNQYFTDCLNNCECQNNICYKKVGG